MQIMFTRRTLMVLSVIAVSSVAGASSKSDPVNHGRGGIAILGYDPVAYFTDSKPLKGDSKFSFTWRPEAWKIIEGKLYLNYSKGVQQKFLQEPGARIQRANQNWPGLHN